MRLLALGNSLGRRLRARFLKARILSKLASHSKGDVLIADVGCVMIVIDMIFNLM